MAGEMPRLENAQLLRHQGVAYLQRGMEDKSFTSFSDSLEFELSQNVVDILHEPFFVDARRLPKVGWMRGQTIGVASFLIPLVIIFGAIMFSGSSSSTANASLNDSTISQASVQPEVTPTVNPVRAQIQLCLNSKVATAQQIYHTCEALRPQLNVELEKATEQSDKDSLTLLGGEIEI
jgi:hypothetical protein